MTIFTRDGWRGWFESMQSPAWDRTDALVFADQCRDWGEGAVEEYVRVAVEFDGLDCSEPFCERYADQMGCSCDECRRYRKNRPVKMRHDKLLADNPSWSRLPCPECPPEGKRYVTCTLCGGSGDLLRYHDTNAHIVRRGEQWPTNPRKLTRWLYTPFVRGVGLRMEEIAEDITRNWAVNMNNLPPPKWEPTPLALSLVAGLPTVRQLRVTDREPVLFSDTPPTGATWGSSDIDSDNPWPDRARIPRHIFDLLRGFRLDRGATSHLKTYTPDAARDALASGAWEWVAGFTKPKGRA